MLLLCHPKNWQIWWFQPSRIPMYGKNVQIISPAYLSKLLAICFYHTTILGESGCVTWLCYHLLIFDPMYMYIFTHVNMYACIKTKTIYVYLQVIHICMYIYLQKWYTKVVSNDVWSKKTHSHMSTRLKPPPAFPIGIRTESIWHVWKSGFPPSKSPWGLQVSEKIKKHWLVVW